AGFGRRHRAGPRPAGQVWWCDRQSGSFQGIGPVLAIQLDRPRTLLGGHHRPAADRRRRLAPVFLNVSPWSLFRPPPLPTIGGMCVWLTARAFSPNGGYRPTVSQPRSHVLRTVSASTAVAMRPLPRTSRSAAWPFMRRIIAALDAAADAVAILSAT